jgi:hypothetical protein
MATRRRREPTPTLSTLIGDEHRAVLSTLLEAHPELRPEAEHAARDLLESATSDAVADEVSRAVEAIPLEDLAARSGRVPGRGYVHENEAAWELVSQAVGPFLIDLRRRARLGLTEATTAITTGIVAGLYDARDPADGTVLNYAGPDAPVELATEVLAEAANLGVHLPADAGDRWPGWSALG